MQYFTVLTLQLRTGAISTASAVLTLTPPITRADIYSHMLEQVSTRSGPEWRDATVLFFSAEPNQIGAS
jgi:hypothetical protein